jgi:hypothetical protein
MLEARGEPDLALEALGTDLLRELYSQKLERHGAIVAEVAREVDRRHPAAPQLSLDSVAPR